MIRSSVLFAIVTFAFFPTVLPASASAHFEDSTYFSTVRYGPFVLLKSSGDTVRVFVEIGHVHRDVAQYDWVETDYSYTFLDNHGNAYVRSVSRCDDDGSSTTMRAKQLFVPRVGPLIILMSQTVPSAPPVCTEGTLYGLDQFDHLVPFSGNIIGCGGMDTTTFLPVLISVGSYGETDSEHTSDSYGQPAIETKDCQPNYTIFHLDPVWWRRDSPGTLRQTKYRIQVDSLYAAGSRQRYRDAEKDSVLSLYPTPSSQAQSAYTTVLRSNSSLKFIDAMQHDGWWLHIVIDGLEGYVNESDFKKLGLSDIY